MPRAMKPDERSFAVKKSSFDTQQHERPGRIVHADPWHAARKAARVLFRRFPDAGDVVELKLVDITKDRSLEGRRKFYYRVTRMKLKTPRKMKFSRAKDDDVTPQYSYVVRSLSESPF